VAAFEVLIGAFVTWTANWEEIHFHQHPLIEIRKGGTHNVATYQIGHHDSYANQPVNVDVQIFLFLPFPTHHLKKNNVHWLVSFYIKIGGFFQHMEMEKKGFFHVWQI